MMMNGLRIAILGAGGLGRGMALMLSKRKGFNLVAMADSEGFAYNPTGLSLEALNPNGQVQQLHLIPEVGVKTPTAIADLMVAHGDSIDAVFMALPNLPVDFYANTIQFIAEKTAFQGVMVDALKRTKAVELLLPLNETLAENNILYITGCGATPGFLTTVAAVAAQSFVEVEHIDIHFGVGVANWEQYRATIREDFLHLEGFDAARVQAMSDQEIEEELEKRNGLIELVNMEHADDIILELAGICDRSKITVGGLVDTRNAKKPTSTTVTVKGVTAMGESTEHKFTVGDATTMVDNVCGPACGFMAKGVELHNYGIVGLRTSAEIMPRFSAEGLVLAASQNMVQAQAVSV